MSRHATHHPTPAAQPARFALRPMVLAVQLAVVGAAASGWADPAHAQAAPASQASARSYDIPAGPLSTVLVRFLSESGVLLSGSTELAKGKDSPGVKGNRTPGEALAALLAGTGLEAVPDGQGRYVLRPAAARTESSAASSSAGSQATATLTEVQVTAQALGDGTTEGTGSYTTRSTSAATGLNLSLRDTPQSVTVVTRQRMDDQAIERVQDALETTAGVSVVADDGARNMVFSRGFSVSNYQIDGVPAQSGWVGLETTSTVLYDRVEMVRGPSGLLNGMGDPSASINLVRKRADSDRFTGSVQAELGSWNHRAATADLSTPLNASGTVRGRLVAHAVNENSYVDLEGKKATVLYGVVEADLTPHTRLSVGASGQSDKRSGVSWNGLNYWYADGTRTDWQRSKTAAARWNRWDTGDRAAFATLDHALSSGWKLRADLSYRKHHEDWKLLWLEGLSDRATGLGMEPWGRIYKYDQAQTQLSFSASGPFQLWGRTHELMVGLTHNRVKYVASAADAPDFAPVGNFNLWNGIYPEPLWGELFVEGTIAERQTAAYAATRLQLSDALKLVLGARLANWTYDYVADWTTFKDRRNNVLIPYGGLVYDLNKQVSAYASYTKIFKPQSFSQDRNGNRLEPVDGSGLEVGVKGAFLDGRLNASAAVFRIEQDKLAVPDEGYLVPGTVFQAMRPAKGAKSQGVELEVAGEVIPGWHLGAAWTKFSARDAQGENVNPAQPRQQFKLFTKVRLGGALAGLTLGGGLAWQSTVPYYLTNPVTGLSEHVGQRAYSVVDLMAHYQITPKTSVQFNVKNLFDKKYYGSSSYGVLVYGAPRSFNAALKYQF
ncbi:MAG: TonB-dependent siderophore receptor [Acidovorax sp.]|uniref:TonB-dependent siderophore receptor n=2 Tax=Comamonadaceae TaxID=80864 RepID=UPI0039E67880